MKQQLVYGLPGLMCIICFWNSLKGQLVHDDIPAIQNNCDLRPENSIYNLLFNDYWGKSMTDNTSHKSYRPLTVLTFRLNYYTDGLQPYGYHAINILLHIITTYLVTHVCLEWVFKSQTEAFLVGCLFAVHPIHTEAVTSIVGRADVLCAIFFLLAILLYNRCIASTRRTCIAYLILCCSSGAMAMLCKEQGITSLAVCVLSGSSHYHSTKGNHKYSRTLFQKHSIILVVWISILLGLRMSIMNGLPVFLKEDNPASFEQNLLTRVLTYSFIYTMNIILVVYPHNLCHDWSHGTIPLIHGLSDPRNLITLSFLCLWISLTWKAFYSQSANERRILKCVILITGVPYLPASNVLFRVGFVIAERILYIPSIGICILIVHSFQNARCVFGAKYQYFIAFMCLTFAVKTMQRNEDWSNRESLARAGVLTHPHNAKLQYNYANVLRSKGLLDDSLVHYKEALRLRPDYSSAHNNLAAVLLTSNVTEAKRHLLSAIHYNSLHANSYFNLANIAWMEGNNDATVRLLRKTLEMDNNCYQCRIFMANALQNRGQFVEQNYLGALYSHQSSLSNFDSFVERAEMTARGGDIVTAIALLTRHVAAVTTVEERARVYFLIGECYKDIGIIANAVNWFLQTIQLMPKHADAHHNLAVVYHMQKNLTEAHYHYRTAIALDPKNDLLRKNFHKFKQLVGNSNVASI